MTTTITPAEIDGRIGELSIEAQRASYAVKNARGRHPPGRRGHPLGPRRLEDDSTRRPGSPSPPSVLLRLVQDEVKARTEHARIIGQIQALDAIWRQHGWTRYYPCRNTNGHIHTSERGCSTVQPTTDMGWWPELSGKTPAEVVELHGPALCSVCYPDAPAGHTSSNLTAIERERTRPERDARKAEIAARRTRTRLTEGPSGEQFRTRYNGDLVETVAACKVLIRNAIRPRWTWSGTAHPKLPPSGRATLTASPRCEPTSPATWSWRPKTPAKAAIVLMQREQRHKGYGMTMDEIARHPRQRGAQRPQGAGTLTTSRPGPPGPGPDPEGEIVNATEIMWGAIPGKSMMITVADGETRMAVFNQDGSWTCPFCTYATLPSDNRPWEHPCSNPICIAGGRGDPEAVYAYRLEVKRREEAESHRAALTRAAEEAADRREQNRLQAVNAFHAERAERGYCLDCWARSTAWGLYLTRARKIRHRKPGNCPIGRRGTRP